MADRKARSRTIGSAYLTGPGLADLRLRAEGPDGMVGDALLHVKVLEDGSAPPWQLSEPLLRVGQVVGVLASD